MSCGRTGRLGNITFKKETTWATYVTPDIFLRASSEGMNRAVEHTEDPSLVGEIYTTDMIKTKDGAAGSIEGIMHGDTIGKLIDGVLGSDAISDPFNAVITATYSGSTEYARVSKTGTDITFELSSDGSAWTPDANIGVAGVVDLTAPANDTFTELSAVIDAATDWNSTLFGDGTQASTNIPDFSAFTTKYNTKQNGAVMLRSNVSASTVSKTHKLTPAPAGTCLPSFTVQVNRVLGVDKSVAFTGTKFGSIGLSAANGDLIKTSVAADSKEELVDQTDVNLTVPSIQGMTAANMKIMIVDSTGAHVPMNEVKDHSLTINTNIDDNRVIGSLTKLEQIRQSATMEMSMTANNTDTQYALRSEYINDSLVETFLYYKSNDEVDADNSIPYSVFIRIPATKFTDYNSPLSTPDRLTISGAGTVVKPDSTEITEHIEVYVVDEELTVY